MARRTETVEMTEPELKAAVLTWLDSKFGESNWTINVISFSDYSTGENKVSYKATATREIK